MDHKRLLLSIFAALLLVLISSTETNACSCYPTHPQTSYCNSEYGKIEHSHFFFHISKASDDQI